MGRSGRSRGGEGSVTLGAGTVVAGKYRICELLAEGAMGRVYLAEQAPIGRQVALKVMRKHLVEDEVAVQRFFREAVAISKLHHPNAVTLIDYGETESGALYLAMEYVRGESLHDLLDRQRTLSLQRALRIVAQVGLVLVEAHKKGLIHRDLKPSNILVCDIEGQSDFVKVIDFGIVSLTETEGVQKLTQTGFTCGTPEYMSPEQALGDPVDPRSDLYTLGVVLFEMLEGHRPYSGASLLALLGRRARPAELAMSEQVPRSIRDFTGRLLAFDRANRPRSAQEMLVELTEALPPGVRLPALELPAAGTELVERPTAPLLVSQGPGEVVSGPAVEATEPTRPATPGPKRVPGLASSAEPTGPPDLSGAPRARSSRSNSGHERAAGRTWMLVAGVALVVAAFAVLFLTGRERPVGTGGGAGDSAGTGGAVALDVPKPDADDSSDFEMGSTEVPKPVDGEPSVPLATTLSFRTAPEGVEVVDLATGATLGYTPFDLPVARSTWPIRLEFRRPGYRTAQRVVIPNQAQIEVDVSLEEEEGAAAAVSTPGEDEAVGSGGRDEPPAAEEPEAAGTTDEDEQGRGRGRGHDRNRRHPPGHERR